jgi:hypothetical protein
MLSVLAAVFLAGSAGIKDIVRSIEAAARINAAKPEATRASGDALTELYVRAACASGAPGDAIVLGLGYALDSSGVIAENPLARDRFESVETKEQAKARLAVIGKPTVRGREDWLEHFVVSAALVPLLGATMAESIGIQKELTDAARKEAGDGSGFSFGDLEADFAGVAFGRWLTGSDSRRAIAACRDAFAVASFVPDGSDLAEGLTTSEFTREWTGVRDPKFTAELERLRKRVAACEGYASDFGKPASNGAGRH